MAVVSNGKVYGIMWFITGLCDDPEDDREYVIKYYEKFYNEELTIQKIDEIKKDYEKLTALEVSNLKFKYYTSCNSEGGNENLMEWLESDRNTIERFLNKEITNIYSNEEIDTNWVRPKVTYNGESLN